MADIVAREEGQIRENAVRVREELVEERARGLEEGQVINIAQKVILSNNDSVSLPTYIRHESTLSNPT